MSHEINEICALINALHEKSIKLKYLAYEMPKDQRDQTEIDNLLSDIKYMAMLIVKG